MAHITFLFIVIVKCRPCLVLRAVLITLIALNHLKNFRKELAEIRKKWKMKVGRSTFHLSSIWGLQECQRSLWENAFRK